MMPKMAMANVPTRDPMLPEWRACIHGLVVYSVEGLPRGTVELRDENGKLIATITNVRQAHVGQKT